MKLCHRHNRGLERIEVAADDGLQLLHQLGTGGDRVDTPMRHRAVRAAPGDRDLEDVIGRHHRTRLDCHVPGSHARNIVHAKDCLHREAIE